MAALITSAAATNASALVAGIGDQNASTFSDPAFVALHVKRTRLIVAWNAINSAAGRAGLDQWMAAAKKLDVLVAFNPAAGQHCPARPCSLPSLKQYTAAFKAFHKRYPRVKAYNFWNETNSPTQPTGPGNHIKAAAKLYVAAKKICGRSCVVTGPDILDLAFNQKSGQKRVIKWVNTFLRFAGRANYPKVWGFHNYGSSNYNRPSETKFFLRQVAKRGQVWVTETGGIVQFTTSTGKPTPFSKYDEKRAARAINFAYSIARKNRSRITRLYYYQWRKNKVNDLFDAGIERFDGSLRPSYQELKRLPKSLWR